MSAERQLVLLVAAILLAACLVAVAVVESNEPPVVEVETVIPTTFPPSTVELIPPAGAVAGRTKDGACVVTGPVEAERAKLTPDPACSKVGP